MEEINANTKLKDIYNNSMVKDVKDSLMINSETFFSDEKTIHDLNLEHPTWNENDIIYGLVNLLRIEPKHSFQLNDGANLLYLPAVHKTSKRYFILCAGGAYGSVCTMIEAMPVAAKLNELGYDCFCLNYHIANKDSFVSGLMPKPLDDLSDAINYVKVNHFNLDADQYYLCGFSAGGHLVACFGLNDLGYKKYGLPKPLGLMLVYPLLSLNSIENEAVQAFMKTGLFGINYKDVSEGYEVCNRLDEDYPKTFIIQCMDDDIVPLNNIDNLEENLKKHDVDCLAERHPVGGHGFGLGSRNPGSDYINRAVRFLEGEKNEI